MSRLGPAIGVGLIYWISATPLGYTLVEVFNRPLFLALPIGLLYGDVPTAMMVGASIQAMYMVIIGPGLEVPANPALAACTAIPLVLTTGMSPEVAVTIAVPFGILGVFLFRIKRTANGVLNRVAYKYAEEANVKGMLMTAGVYPFLISFPITFLPVFLVNYLGDSAIHGMLHIIPEWVMHGFEVAGGLLPAIGFAIAITSIGRTRLLPFFIIGYFLIKYSAIPIIGAAIFGICIAFIYTQCMGHEYDHKEPEREV